MNANSENTLPFSQACENNKQPILLVLSRYLLKPCMVLEVGSGTAQHAVYFAQRMPHLTWQPTEIPAGMIETQKRLTQAALPNVSALKALDVTQSEWPEGFDAVFTANTLHIMSWAQAQTFIISVARYLPDNGLCFIYGPFNYNSQFTSESNQAFDAYLKRRDPLSGIRDFEKIEALFNLHDMILVEDMTMPANNKILVWKKQRH